jgi:hypothetical protein
VKRGTGEEGGDGGADAGWCSICFMPERSFGRHGVCLRKDELAGKQILDFTRYLIHDSK